MSIWLWEIIWLNCEESMDYKDKIISIIPFILIALAVYVILYLIEISLEINEFS